MTIPFYKLQLAGNGFILIDLQATVRPDANGTEGGSPTANRGKGNAPEGEISPDDYPALARLLCDKRYGIGANGAIFLSQDNTIRIFGARGKPSPSADDAILCAARFAFDSGRILNRTIVFRTPRGDRLVEVLGAHEFRIGCGSPFALLGGKVVTPKSERLVETIEHEGASLSCSALHIREDVVTAFPRSMGTLDYASFSALVRKAFPGKDVIPVIAQAVTSETVLVKAWPRQESAVCAAASAALVTAVCSGQADNQAVVMFESQGSGSDPDAEIARDRDNSRRLAVSWDTEDNEVYVIGSGGYLFDGKFDAPEPADLR